MTAPLSTSLPTFGTTAADYFFHSTTGTDNLVGQTVRSLEKGVKNYGFAETCFSVVAVLIGVEAARMGYRGACNSWKKGNVGTAVVWSGVAIGSIFLAGWEICRATRNGSIGKAPVEPVAGESGPNASVEQQPKADL